MLKKVKNPKKNNIIILSTILIFLIVTVISLYITLNIYIYKNILKQNQNEIIELNIPISYPFISSKNIDLINSLNKHINFKLQNYEYTMNSSNINKCINLKNIKFTKKQSSLDEFKNLNVIEIELFNEHIDNFKIHDIDFLQSDLFDVYYFDNTNSTYVLHKSMVTTNDVIITKKIDNSNIIKKYLLVYVPLTGITSENIEINKTLSKALNITFEPTNATNKELIFNYEPKNAFEIDNSHNIKANIPGEYTLTISSKDNSISKNVNIKIHEVVTNITPSKNQVSLTIGESLKLECQIEPENAINKELIFISSNENISTVSSDGTIYAKNYGKCEIEIKTKLEPVFSIKIPVSVNYKISTSSIAVDTKELTYVQGVLIVNKKYGLPKNYNPGINSEAYNAYKNMANDASKEGISLPILSAYRSYETQAATYNNYLAMYGYEYANRISAQPGKSEHQTGLAFDIGSLYISYENTKEGKWLADNCHKYGFIIRYPKGKEHITGYIYEPWHIRYLGLDLAAKVKNSGLCLEEYLNIV